MDRNVLDGLLALKLVAEKRNFTAAADALGISPPAISKMIKQLEKRLGVTLLHRTTRATHPTEVGAKFLSQAGPALEQILAAVEEVGTYAEKPSGLLRLNVPTLIYPNYLSKVVASFIKKYPDVSVELCFENAAVDVFERGFDAGIRLSDILAKDVVALKMFGPIRFVIVGSPKYFAKHGRPKHPKDLLTHNCIRVCSGNWMYDRWEFENKGKDFEVQVKGSLIMNDSVLALDACIDGMGLSYVSEDVVSERLASGKLETVLDDFVATSTGFYLYFPQRLQVQPKLRVFIDHMKAYNESLSKSKTRSRIPQ